jgi:hypothetical protein
VDNKIDGYSWGVRHVRRAEEVRSSMSSKKILQITIAVCILIGLTVSSAGMVGAVPPGSDTKNPNDGAQDRGHCWDNNKMKKCPDKPGNDPPHNDEPAS